MDDEAASPTSATSPSSRYPLLARRVALAASAWLNAPTDVQAYTRLVDAVERWNGYSTGSWPPRR